MAGKYLRRAAMIDVLKSAERTNAIQKRNGLGSHPVRFTSCGCPDDSCGGWHTIIKDRTVPTVAECEAIVKANNKARRPSAKN